MFGITLTGFVLILIFWIFCFGTGVLVGRKNKDKADMLANVANRVKDKLQK